MSSALLPGADQPNVDKGPSILGVCCSMTLLALSFVCARIFVRANMVHKIGPDDYAIMFAMALSLTGMALVIPEVTHGAGRHIAYLDPATATIGLKLNFATQPIYLWAITIVKVSIALFLLRIAPRKFYAKFLWGVIAFLIIYTAACFMTIMLQCRNLAILWDSTVETTCWEPTTLRALSYLNVGLNIMTDLLFAALPIPMLWNVQINGRTKASVICIMSLGVFACAAAIVKTSFLPNYGKTGDFLWDSTNLTIWTVIECDTGIIAACLPCLKPLFKHILDKSKGYGSSKSNGHSLHTLRPGNIPGSKHRTSVTTGVAINKTMNSFRNLKDNESEENILPLHRNGITKTTVVTADNSTSTSEERPERHDWSKGADVATERKIEDRV